MSVASPQHGAGGGSALEEAVLRFMRTGDLADGSKLVALQQSSDGWATSIRLLQSPAGEEVRQPRTVELHVYHVVWAGLVVATCHCSRHAPRLCFSAQGLLFKLLRRAFGAGSSRQFANRSARLNCAACVPHNLLLREACRDTRPIDAGGDVWCNDAAPKGET
jgi:hypothetical protein